VFYEQINDDDDDDDDDYLNCVSSLRMLKVVSALIRAICRGNDR